jgi:hypothetical protein
MQLDDTAHSSAIEQTAPDGPRADAGEEEEEEEKEEEEEEMEKESAAAAAEEEEEEEEGWELVAAAGSGDGPPEIVSSKSSRAAAALRASNGSEAGPVSEEARGGERGERASAEDGAAGREEDGARLEAAGPTFGATVLVAAFAALFLILSMFMAVGMFSWAVGAPPAKQSGALTFYRAQPAPRQHRKRAAAAAAPLPPSMPKHRLLENRIKIRNASSGLNGVSMIAGLVRFERFEKRGAALARWNSNKATARYHRQNTSIVRIAASISNALANPFLPQLCPPRRICLPPPGSLLATAFETTNTISFQSKLTTTHETFERRVKSICDGCMEAPADASAAAGRWHIDKKHDKSKALAPRRFGALANLSMLSSRRFMESIAKRSAASVSGLKKWRLKTKRKNNEGSPMWHRLLQQGRNSIDVASPPPPPPPPPRRRRRRLPFSILPTTTTRTANVEADSPRNMSLMVMTIMPNPPPLMVKHTTPTIHTTTAKTELVSPGTFDVNAVLGVKRLSFLGPNVTPLGAPNLVASSSLFSKMPAVFPVVLGDMFTWRYPAEAPKICTLFNPPPKLVILNGTFSNI